MKTTTIKKMAGTLLATTMLFALTACAGTQNTPPLAAPAPLEADTAVTPTNVTEPAVQVTEEETAPHFVTVTYFDAAAAAHEATVLQNPTTVAIFDWSILDILYTAGWENTGIETLIIPATATMPDEVAWFENQDFVKRGGTLHYVNWDILDLTQPELVILGTRSFAHNAAGETTSAEVRAELRAHADETYPDTAFIRLTQNSQNSDLANDMKHNVYVLQQIFPNIADDLQAHLDDSLARLEYVGQRVRESESTALFVMVWADRMSFFLPNSRFHMIYDEFGFISPTDELPEWGDQHGFDARAEFILSVNPDVLLVLDRTDMDSPTGGVGIANFMADSIIQNTAAAQNGHIYVLRGNSWYTVTGGLSALDTKIANIIEFVDQLD